MNRDNIIRMAQQAGMFKLFGDPNAPEALTGESIERFAALIAAAEREACAKVCESQYIPDGSNEDVAAIRCADAIRARGEK